jgi:hypothetical protein
MEVLNATSDTLAVTPDKQELAQATLTQWNELCRTGLLGVGKDLDNPNLPNFHLTSRGHAALESFLAKGSCSGRRLLATRHIVPPTLVIRYKLLSSVTRHGSILRIRGAE